MLCCFQGPHYKLLEMINWQRAVLAIQKTCTASVHLLVAVGADVTSQPSSSTCDNSFRNSEAPLSSSFSVGIPHSSHSSSNLMHTQRNLIETCEIQIQKLEPVVSLVLGRLCEPYSGVDIEFAAVQKPILEDFLALLSLLRTTCLADVYSKHTLPGVWVVVLRLVGQLLALMPLSLKQIHVRDMRYVQYTMRVAKYYYYY